MRADVWLVIGGMAIVTYLTRARCYCSWPGDRCRRACGCGCG